ncbi:uncharacterized protein DUF2135 [Dysgonomonas alginatilytica]|uniref:Uncharacterized protein DUF2135 n=1 Tax=Dysgonomonas alginatilytica TaxID=1605892 RepID=A0A2V3PVM3_9BACT|nr:VIT domain-containing protein [Dysgonomonas alginatilytica]PXV68138.1 uncharacterized protein DUF2135 [Dysgonomonas alginatilytica]
MKKYLTLILLCLLSITVWAQEQRSPNIQINGLSKDESPVRISDVKIDVKVVGSLAVTTVDMTFYNPNNRILEGELQFPLADGQSISRFALDINGNLREGVVVEKAKGQEVFESTIRRKVDPGLLEKTVGNNFRTRVYPLPAKGTRRIVIAYEQELTKGNDDYLFFLPVEYRDVLDNFSLNIAVHADGQKPTVEKTPWGSFSFDKSGEAYLASYSAKQYPSKGQLVFSIPIKSNKQIYIEKGLISSQPVFYAQVFPSLTVEAKQSPKNIALFWDASSSMNGRNLPLEIELLDNYFKENGNLTVELYTFNCILGKSQTFPIKNGNWDNLKDVLKNIPYDGATQLGLLDFSKLNVDEILLFTDGLSNFGKSQPIMGKSPVSVITSSLSANHSLLKYINISSGGTYINLMSQTPQDAAKMMKNESFRLISADYDKSEISDLTTSGTVVNPKAGFTMAGKLKKQKASITLSFGIGSRVLYTETLVIDQNNIADYGNIVERVWAEKKIAELDLLFDKNKDEIESLGRKYNIVTRNTSLIVLDDVQDYVTHRITPPAELLDEYNRIVSEQEIWNTKQKQDRIQAVISMLEARKAWWNRDFRKEMEEAKKRAEEEEVLRRERAQNQRAEPTSGRSMIARQTNSYNGRGVSGIIKDETGEPLIGVSVNIKGTNTGTVSDLDGKYSINAKVNEVLRFSFVGMNSIEVSVRGSELDVVLADDQATLNDVVVVGYGAQRRSDLTGSVSQFTAPETVADELQGRVAGIQVSESESQDIRRRSPKSVSSNNSPSESLNYKLTAGITLNKWSPDAAYLNELKTKSDKELYASYLSIRDEYKSTPSFFLEVSTLFEERGLKDEALIILSNLAELEVENYRLTRVLAHRLKQMGYNDYAIDQFKLLLTLRPEEPQTYRDLGLAYAQNKEYQQAVNTLYKMLERRWDTRFPQVEMFAVEEINNVIDKAKREKIELDLSSVDNRLIYNMPVNIRVVLNWDTDNSDMDLWVTDPNGEKCFYSHKQTRIGGLMSYDFTGGYGPEEFLIKEAIRGKYKIQANYYGSSEQTLVGPTTIYLDIYTYYSSGKEKKETITLRLSSNKETIDIGEVNFE